MFAIATHTVFMFTNGQNSTHQLRLLAQRQFDLFLAKVLFLCFGQDRQYWRRDKYMSFVNDVIAVFEHDKTKFDLNREGH